MATVAPFDSGAFIVVDPDWHDGWAHVRGTRKTVASVAVLYNEGCSAEDIASEKLMTPAEVHAALCYYLANREHIDTAIDAADARTDAHAKAWPTKRRS